MDETGARSDLGTALEDMGKLLILARMAARDGEYERVKDSLYELVKGATASYLMASRLHRQTEN